MCAVLPFPSSAADCSTQIRDIDLAIASRDLGESEKQQLTELLDKASNYCTAGETEDAEATIGQLMQILGMN